MYKHYDNDDSLISLHDCHAERQEEAMLFGEFGSLQTV